LLFHHQHNVLFLINTISSQSVIDFECRLNFVIQWPKLNHATLHLNGIKHAILLSTTKTGSKTGSPPFPKNVNC